MALGIKLSKTDIAKIFAVGIVLVFVIQILVGYLPNAGRSGGDGSQSPTSYDTFDGTGTANGTVTSWDPVLIVIGDDARIAAEISKLKGEGLVTYSSAAQGATVVNLASAKDVSAVAIRLLSDNATVLGDASVSLSNIKVAGADFQRDVPPTTFRYRMPPMFEVGDTMALSFNAKVVNGQMYTVSNLALPTPEPLISIAHPDSVRVVGEFYRANVPWESRNALNQQMVAGTFGKYGNATYKVRSFIGVTPDFSSAQGQQLANALPNYALGAQQNIMPVVRGFNDSARAKADLAKYGMTGDFPPAVIEIRPKDGKLDIGELNDVMNGTYGMNVTFGRQYDVEITIPAKVPYGGAEYTLLNNTMMATAARLPSSSALSAFRFTPYGRWGINLEAVSFLEQDLFNGTNTDSTAVPAYDATAATGGNNATAATGGDNTTGFPANGSYPGFSKMPSANGTGGPSAQNSSGVQP